MFTEVSINFFKTTPCSADKGTAVPPVVRSFTISALDTLEIIAVVFVEILEALFAIAASFIFTWASKILSASLKEAAL